MELGFITCTCPRTVHDLHMLEPIEGTELFTVVHRDGTKLSSVAAGVMRFSFTTANLWAKVLDGE
jgi:hypothetical protein